MKNEYWKKFEQTGYVGDYLEYVRCKCDGIEHEGANHNESGKRDRNGTVGDANWRV